MKKVYKYAEKVNLLNIICALAERNKRKAEAKKKPERKTLAERKEMYI